VRSILQNTILTSRSDIRLSLFCVGWQRMDSSSIYRMLKSRGAEQDANFEFIWSSTAPPRVKLFIWLLVHGRTQCRANLHKKGVVDSTTCKVCSQGDETTEHIISGCPFSVSFWAAIGVDVPLHGQLQNYVRRRALLTSQGSISICF
jgi:hypothetical protein